MSPDTERNTSSSPASHRLAALLFPPDFFAALSHSALGPLPDLLARLDAAGRAELAGFAQALRPGLRHEMLGDAAAAAAIYRELAAQDSRFALIARERLQRLGESAP